MFRAPNCWFTSNITFNISFQIFVKNVSGWEHSGNWKVNTEVDPFGLFVNVVGEHSCSIKARILIS